MPATPTPGVALEANGAHPPHPGLAAKAKKEATRKRFEGAFATIRSELLGHFSTHGMPPDAVDWYSRVLDYNVPGGKLNRGISVIDTAQILKGRALTDEEYMQAAVLGWGIEFMQAFFLVSDDLMDSSVTRRGQPCWYRQPDVGTIAVNDALLLEGAMYQMMRKHFRGEPYYTDLMDLFHEVSYETEMGQLVDLITAPETKVDLSKFSLERHSLIVIYKTAFYSFYLPVACAMLICGIPMFTPSPSSSDPSDDLTDPYKTALEILLPLGEYFQIQDDFLDFSAPPEILGKIGTDIIDNKCSWCINTALSLATPAQRAILDTNYGKKDPECERRVKKVFEEVGVRQEYEEYEKDVYERLCKLIAEVPEGGVQNGGVKREVFTSFLEKIYKRQK
ncbi:hypothetical protein EW146_g6679 [Bondarzewia mesenterica]|uniref:(2E,6E)-farnesyl diphosphate synthase n=1 Tax=Bondarzewia mesenterica TaxID=1095465 RepID=A0A4V6S1D9_9AGAM|nr:hypothetical protein EW146_g6679 [Bondarzewia mesenterica]